MYSVLMNMDKLRNLEDLFNEPSKKLLHGTRLSAVNSIMSDGLWVYHPRLELTTREVKTTDKPTIFAEYWYGEAFESFHPNVHRCIIIAIPNEMGNVKKDSIVEYSGEVPEDQHVHYYDGGKRRCIAPEFVRGVCSPSRDFTSNRKWIMDLANSEEMIEWHMKRIGSGNPLNYDYKKPELQLR